MEKTTHNNQKYEFHQFIHSKSSFRIKMAIKLYETAFKEFIVLRLLFVSE